MNTNIFIPEPETEISNTYRSGDRIYTRVVGVTYNGRQAAIARLSIGEELLLKREPDNQFDHNAILVENLDSQQIGYLDRRLAATIAPFFDTYLYPIHAVVYRVTGRLYPEYSMGAVILFSVP